MALTDVNVASRALVLIGADTISDFDPSPATTESTVAKNLYEGFVEAAISKYRWRFATGQIDLSRLAAKPEARWDSAYQMPTSPPILVLHAVTVLSNPIKYDRYESKIYCNATSDDIVTADYTYRVDTVDWPPYFTEYVVYKLASVFASSIAQKATLAELLGQQASIFLQEAKTVEAQQQTTRQVKSRRLIDARR
jgi:hypothetical protein